MSKLELKDKQCVDGVCQFCGRNGRPEEEDSDLEDGWLVLRDVTAQFWGIYGEWCSVECFWYDILCQAYAENPDNTKNIYGCATQSEVSQ